MLITIGLFLAVVILLLIGYVGELLSSAADRQTEEETQHSIETDAAFESNGSC